MNWKLFFSTYVLIFVAELPDKTAMATLVMAAQGPALPIFIGASAAFVIQSLVAVLCGSYIGRLSGGVVNLGVGLLFLLFAYLALRKSLQPPSKGGSHAFQISSRRGFWMAIGSSFLVIFIAEWGDLTQLATAALAAKSSNPITIFCAATLALWSVTALTIVLGRYLQKFIQQKQLQQIAAAVFLLVGMYFVLQVVGS